MEEFEANPMKGTSFDISEGDEPDLKRKVSSKTRDAQEIQDMIEDITQRMKFYETSYKRAKKSNDRVEMISSLRNFKALEGARQSLRWVLKDTRVKHPLF
tara:strand:- start:175 stop:474 length:300 start_codon:yes stop_codon:yes gene_type:complete